MAGFLLDTNVVSELRKRRGAHPAVMRWLRGQPDELLFLSVATFGEIRMGVERLRLRDPVQAISLERWLVALGSRYRERILEATHGIFDCWGRLQAIRPVGAMDGLLAATAMEHDLVLVTRNGPDFQGLGVRILNPFQDPTFEEERG